MTMTDSTTKRITPTPLTISRLTAKPASKPVQATPKPRSGDSSFSVPASEVQRLINKMNASLLHNSELAERLTMHRADDEWVLETTLNSASSQTQIKAAYAAINSLWVESDLLQKERDDKRRCSEMERRAIANKAMLRKSKLEEFAPQRELLENRRLAVIHHAFFLPEFPPVTEYYLSLVVTSVPRSAEERLIKLYGMAISLAETNLQKLEDDGKKVISAKVRSSTTAARQVAQKAKKLARTPAPHIAPGGGSSSKPGQNKKRK